MQDRPMLRRSGVFLAAVAATAVAGTLVQTQINLAAIAALGAPVTLADRLRVSAADLLGFTPTLAALAFAALLLALPAAALLARRGGPGVRAPLYALAGWAGLMAAFGVADALAPMPTLIAATRSLPGALAVAASGALGGWLYARFARRAPPSRPLAQGA
ncbi:hypothetical protein V8Z80_09560 [Orrella sp. JC864]|uniref:hypothetical protein n=1 Tax=Orrella sp. JC864 TaxID=3120298 RepID=UPI00300B4253